MKPRAEQSRAIEKREAILTAATEILLSEGLRDVTHRQVAMRAGVPVGSIGYYYSSREKLLMTCMSAMGKQRTAAAAEQLAQAQPSDSDAVVARRVVDSLTAGGVNDLPGLIGALIDSLREPGQLSQLVTELYEDFVADVEEILVASGIAREAVHDILDTVMGTIMRSRLEKHEMRPSVVDAVATVIARHR